MKTSILIIEDNPADTELIVEMLKAEGLKFESASAARLDDALVLLAEKTFDVVLVDLGLPDSRGLNTFQSVIAQAGDAPVIVLTGLADENTGMKAVSEGAQDYLAKGTITSLLLARSIKYAMERKRLERELREKVYEIERINRILAYGRDMEIEDLRREVQKLKRKAG